MTTFSPPSAVRGHDSLLRVNGLSVSFGALSVLAGVDLRVAEGEILALAGEPGSGKTSLVRCVAGDLVPDAGEVLLQGRPIAPDLRMAGRRGVGIVWQGPALCNNLDVAGNVLLGRESPRLLVSTGRLHTEAAALLSELEIPIRDTTRLVGSLSGGQRQLVAIAKAMSRRPRLLVLDEPSERLAVAETAVVEQLLRRLRDEGMAILLTTGDLDQMFRVADRIAVLHKGAIVAELDPRRAHRDDLAALLAGQEVDATARRQLTRLHGLADRLVSADPSSSLSLILSAMGAALGIDKIVIHVVNGGSLECAAWLGVAPAERGWSRLPIGPAGGAPGRAADLGELIVEEDLTHSDTWAIDGDLAGSQDIASSWSVPVVGLDGVSAVITTFGGEARGPERDELDLVALYSGYAASAVERDRLLHQVTARNRVLETIREMLEALAGPGAVRQGLSVALDSLRTGLGADEVALFSGLDDADGGQRCAYVGPLGSDPGLMSAEMRAGGREVIWGTQRDGRVLALGASGERQILAVPFTAPGGPRALLARRPVAGLTEQEQTLIENAAHSLRLALERQESERASREAAALRRSRELQRSFLSKLSHELRTPLTAIKGYASSLMADDVVWDKDSERRFLHRIEAESARVGRLVDDLLDFSAIESGIMRLHLDWCDLSLVLDAALACLPAAQRRAVSVSCDAGLPAVWGDHDRLEQVFVNLLGNAFRHNPPRTHVWVSAGLASTGPRGQRPEAEARLDSAAGKAAIEITVADDGIGFPADLAAAPFETGQRDRSSSAGAGLGLSIARGIVLAHGGVIELVPAVRGAEFRILLAAERPEHDDAGSDILQLIESQEAFVSSAEPPRALGAADDG